ncbi:MAG: hypothetical protein JWM21_952 [Acidobacteria bacterium]|nr:hypothetical protein [Acidobacteriota bacterium]
MHCLLSAAVRFAREFRRDTYRASAFEPTTISTTKQIQSGVALGLPAHSKKWKFASLDTLKTRPYIQFPTLLVQRFSHLSTSQCTRSSAG